MAENVYEGMFILDSNSYAKDAEATVSSVTDILEKNGGELLASRLWSEQKLAYPIGSHRKGTYWLTYFRMDSLRLADVNSALRLNNDVIRNLIIKIEPRLVEAMVAHALGQATEPTAEGDGEAAAEGSEEKKEAKKEPATADA